MKEIDKFLKELKESIEITDKKNQKKPSQSYKPSSLKCIRNMFYQVTGEDPDISDSSYINIGICETGTDMHVRIQQAIEEMINNNFDCEYVDVETYLNQFNIPDIEVKGKSGMETKLYSPKYNVSFMCDGIIRYQGVYHIIEFKTETSRKFNPRFDVDDEHRNQARAYSLLLGLPDVWFIYICRDNSDKKAFEYIITDEERRQLAQKILTCNYYVDNKILPPKPQDISIKTCQYCNYKSKCKQYEN